MIIINRKFTISLFLFALLFSTFAWSNQIEVLKNHLTLGSVTYRCATGIKETSSNHTSGGNFLRYIREDGVKGTISSHNGSWSKVHATSSNPLYDVDVNLGSEKYNASYMVSICFKAPQINVSTAQLNAVGFRSQYSFDLFSAVPSEYVEAANLEIEAILSCHVYEGATQIWSRRLSNNLNDVLTIQTHRYFDSCKIDYVFKERNSDSTRHHNLLFTVDTHMVLNAEFYSNIL